MVSTEPTVDVCDVKRGDDCPEELGRFREGRFDFDSHDYHRRMSTRRGSAIRVLVLVFVFMVAVEMIALRSRPEESVPYGNAAKSFPVLETLAKEHVTFLRVQDWCHAYADDQERRASDVTATCTLEGDYKLFDSTSEQRFADLRDRLTGLPYSVHWIDIEYDAAGVIRTAELSIDTVNPFRRDTLVYEPGYLLPEGIRGEVVNSRIDANWYHRWEDWN